MKCPYCRDELKGSGVKCPNCGTNYHEECFTTCSVFGCNGKKVRTFDLLNSILWVNAIVVFLLFAFACGGMHKPPVPPPPPDVCGNGLCDPTESNANCPADCAPTPACNHNGVCEADKGETPVNCIDCDRRIRCGDNICNGDETPATCPTDCKSTEIPKCGDGICNGKETPQTCPDCTPEPSGCDPANYIFDTCPKITRDFTQHITLGNYVGTYGQPKFDWIAYYKLFKKFNGSSEFLLDSWNNLEWWPWEVKAGKVDLSKWNEQWWTNYRNSLKAAAYYDIEKSLCMITDYGNEEWQKYKGIAKTHPFRTNVQRSNIADGKPSMLYTNWTRRLPVKTNCSVMSWKEDDEYAIEYYKECSPSGLAFMSYVQRAAKEAYEVWKGGKLRLRIRTANEPTAVVDTDGKTFIREKGKLIDDRTENFVIETFKKAGFKNGDHFRIITENETFTGSVAGAPAMYWPDKTMKMYIKPRGYLMEWHGICDAKTQAFFTQTHGYDTEYFNGSMDGCKYEHTKAYFDGARSIVKTKPKNFDYKLSACYGGAQCWDDKDMNHNVGIFVPKMEKELWP